MTCKNVVFIFFSFFLLQTTFAQTIPAAQDSTLNNLIHPKGYITCKPGELGAVKKTGSAKQSMIIIAGLGFGADVFNNFINHHKKDYTIY